MTSSTANLVPQDPLVASGVEATCGLEYYQRREGLAGSGYALDCCHPFLSSRRRFGSLLPLPLLLAPIPDNKTPPGLSCTDSMPRLVHVEDVVGPVGMVIVHRAYLGKPGRQFL